MTAFAFPGLNLAVTTPFDAAGRIDLGRLEDHLEKYLAAGIDGVVLSSGTGMHVYLSRGSPTPSSPPARGSSPAGRRSSSRPPPSSSRTSSPAPATPPTTAPTG